MIWETIFGKVVGKANNYQAVPDGQGGRRIIKNKAVRDYERSFCRQCELYRDAGIDDVFTFHIKVYLPSMACDLDNAIKTVLDCLQYVHAITDDNKCMKIDAEKHIDGRRPRIEFAIEQVAPLLFDNENINNNSKNTKNEYREP